MADGRAEAIRLGAVQALLDLGMSTAVDRPSLTLAEQQIADALEAGASAVEIGKQFMLSGPRLAFACVRIVHAYRPTG